ncbi:MAG: SpoIID/LytB domain-containing protein [Planctomycetota bacterium]
MKLHRYWTWGVVAVLCLVVLAGSVSCRRASNPPPPGPRPAPQTQTQVHPHQLLTGETKQTAMRGPRLASVAAEPQLRIRIERSSTSLQVGGNESLTVGPGQRDRGRSAARSFAGPIRVRHDGSGFVITDALGNALRWPLSTLHINNQAGEIAVNDGRFPGSLELVALHEQAKYTGYIDVVNYVGMEQYLPGVLSQEMYPNWDLEAYKAQAVAARSYAIWEMNLPVRTSSHFDLEAGEASQAYIGSNAHATARRAVAETRGLVLVYDQRVLPAFYSSCSGGIGQDATAAFPGRVAGLAPLRGRDQGSWGRASTKFAWGPVSYTKPKVIASMRRWGELNEHPLARLSSLRTIQATSRTGAGRPAQYTVTDDAGRRYTLGPEQLRRAANTGVPGNPHETGTRKLWSGFIQVNVQGETVTFNGRGFGHGVGMCQFGAQGLAESGRPYHTILGFYYPGAQIQRAY